jgi:hypothetical protein
MRNQDQFAPAFDGDAVMKNKMVLVALLTAGVVGPLSTSGYDRWYAGRHVAAGYAVGAGMGGYGYGGGVGTAFSAQENARANTIRAQGEFNVMNTAAMSNFEEARSRYIDNLDKWTEVYGERQRALAAQKEADREAALAARERAREFQATRPPSGPSRLTTSQLDPSTGRIQWPTALMAATFEGQRKSLDALFEMRVHTSTNPGLASNVDKAVSAMRDSLRAKIREIPSQEYLEARRFLDSLALEGRSAVG